jgi:hypothetical protein
VHEKKITHGQPYLLDTRITFLDLLKVEE